MCRKEYGIAVKARLVDTTLGVLVPIPGLLEELMKQSGAEGAPPIPMLVEGQYQEQKFHFQFLFRGQLVRVDKSKPERESHSPVDQERSKPLKMLDQVSTAMRRVALSTDARLEFYTLIAQDPGPANLELIFAGHLDDLKRVQYMDISLGELQRRSRVSVRHQPEAAARQTVQMFLEDLTDRPLPQLLSRYVAPSRKFKELFPKILECAVELQGHTQDLLKGEWAVRQIQKDQVLVYVPLAPIGRTGAYLFTVQIREGQAGLFDLERLQTDALPARFQTLGEPATWKGFFYLEPLVFSQFLSEQIAKRALSEFELLDRDKESKSKHPPKPVTDEEVSRVVVETSAYVLNSYRFSDFKELTITDAVKGTRWVISAKDLPIYRRRNAPALQPVS
ncbi:MAG: hypothetical protein HY211_02400 [Candidatus Omnitrophica bacterium]|nr:hypothetical protein [Candidatus Omnitrophota bacterium]